jgi:hypothetical protein
MENINACLSFSQLKQPISEYSGYSVTQYRSLSGLCFLQMIELMESLPPVPFAHLLNALLAESLLSWNLQ